MAAFMTSPEKIRMLARCLAAAMVGLTVLPAHGAPTASTAEKPVKTARSATDSKPGYRIVDGDIVIKDGKRYINIYLRYDDGKEHPPRQASKPPPLTFAKHEYSWALDLVSQGRRKEAAALFERCALVNFHCVYTIRDDLGMLAGPDAAASAYFNTIVLNVVEKNLDKKYYAQLLGILDPLHLPDVRKTLALIHKARDLHGDLEEFRSLEEQIFMMF